MSNEKTITVKDTWGKNIQMTRKEFVGRWHSQATNGNTFWLDPSDTWKEEIDTWRDRVAEKASEEFDRLFREQNGEAV